MKRTHTHPQSFDLTFPCEHCGDRIPPHELIRTGGEPVRCPKCGEESVYGRTPKP